MDENYDLLFQSFKKQQDQYHHNIIRANMKFEALNKQQSSAWGKHQEKLSEMVLEALANSQ